MHIELKVLNNKILEYGKNPLRFETEGAAAMDLRAMISDPLTMLPGKTVLIGTGISIHIKDPNYVGLIVPRSGLGHKQGLVLGNGTGVIDSDYQGELKVSLTNRSPAMPHQMFDALSAILAEHPIIKPGDRIAQLMILPIARPEIVMVDSFSNDTQRGEGGFGSTGVTDNADTVA